MMRLLGILNEHGHDSRGVYECDTCYSFELSATRSGSEPDEETEEMMSRFVKGEVVPRVISDLHEQVKGVGHGTQATNK